MQISLVLQVTLVFFVHVEQTVQAPVQANRRNLDMSDELRKQVYQALLARIKNGHLGKKDTRIVADNFGVHIWSI